MRWAAEEEEAVIGWFGLVRCAGVDFSEACGGCVGGLRGELTAQALEVAEREVGAEVGSGLIVRAITSLVSGPARGKTQSACVL